MFLSSAAQAASDSTEPRAGKVLLTVVSSRERAQGSVMESLALATEHHWEHSSRRSSGHYSSLISVAADLRY
jgi:hypothetical protein